jgi:hypothetical protein
VACNPPVCDTIDCGAGIVDAAAAVARAKQALIPDQTKLTFAQTTVDQTGATQNVTFTNTGTSNITPMFALTDAVLWFSIGADTCSQQQLAPGAQCSISLTLKPQVPTTRTSAELTLHSNAAISQSRVKLAFAVAKAPAPAPAPAPALVVTSTPTTTTAPTNAVAQSGSGGGGGCAVDMSARLDPTLSMLLLAAAAYLRRRYPALAKRSS